MTRSWTCTHLLTWQRNRIRSVSFSRHLCSANHFFQLIIFNYTRECITLTFLVISNSFSLDILPWLQFSMTEMYVLRTLFLPQVTWSSWFSIVPQSQGLLVWFLVRAHAWGVAGSPVGAQSINVSLTHRCFSPSLSPFLPLSLKINK